MMLHQSIPGLLAVSAMIAAKVTLALPHHVSMEKQVVVRSAPSLTSEETRSALGRSVADIIRRNGGNALAEKNTTLDQSWKDETLFNHDGVEVICTDCYIRGTASARLSTNSSGDEIQTGITEVFDGLTGAIGDVTQATLNWIEDVKDSSSELPGGFIDDISQTLTDASENPEGFLDIVKEKFEETKDHLEDLFGDVVDKAEEAWDESPVGEIVDKAKEVWDESPVGEIVDKVSDEASDLWDSIFKKRQEEQQLLSFDQLDKFELPSLDLEDLDLESIGETLGADLHLDLHGFEVYLMMDTILSAEKKKPFFIHLFDTSSPLTLGDEDSVIGVSFTVELYLIPGVEDVDMSSGVHFSSEELAFDLKLFSDDIADLTFNGGQFELLPVTLNGIGAVDIKAGLRLSIKAGIDAGLTDGLSAGMSVSVFADLAQFDTKITFDDDENDDDNKNCETKIEQDFEINVGAKAGASISVLGMNFGPRPSVKTPIFSTHLPSHCLEDQSRRPATTPTATIPWLSSPAAATTTISTPPSVQKRRDDDDDDDNLFTTTTTIMPITMQAIACDSPGLVYCPASLQTRIKTVSTKTITTVLPPSSTKPPFSSAFGTDAHDIVVAGVITPSSPSSSPTPTATP